MGEQSEPFRQPRLQVGGCEQSFRRVWACVVGESPRKRSVELREVWEVVRVRCGWVAEWVSLLSQLLPPPYPGLLSPAQQLSSRVPASPLPPELRCHEAGETLQLRTLAHDWPPSPLGLAELLRTSGPDPPAGV